jgi:hypothetical protein
MVGARAVRQRAGGAGLRSPRGIAVNLPRVPADLGDDEDEPSGTEHAARGQFTPSVGSDQAHTATAAKKVARAYPGRRGSGRQNPTVGPGLRRRDGTRHL